MSSCSLFITNCELFFFPVRLSRFSTWSRFVMQLIQLQNFNIWQLTTLSFQPILIRDKPEPVCSQQFFKLGIVLNKFGLCWGDSKKISVLVLQQPIRRLIVLEFATEHIAISPSVKSLTMLHIFLKASFVCIPFRGFHKSLTMFQPILEFTFIKLMPSFEKKQPEPVGQILLKLPLINIPICPFIRTSPIFGTLLPFPFINISCNIGISSLPFKLPLLKFALVLISIRCRENSLTLHLIHNKFSLILIAINIGKLPLSMELILKEITLVDISIFISVGSFPLHKIVIEIPEILVSTYPLEDSSAVLSPLNHISNVCVASIILHFVYASC